MIPDQGNKYEKIHPAIMEECVRTEDRLTDGWGPFLFPNSAIAEQGIISITIIQIQGTCTYFQENSYTILQIF